MKIPKTCFDLYFKLLMLFLIYIGMQHCLLLVQTCRTRGFPLLELFLPFSTFPSTSEPIASQNIGTFLLNHNHSFLTLFFLVIHSSSKPPFNSHVCPQFLLFVLRYLPSLCIPNNFAENHGTIQCHG